MFRARILFGLCAALFLSAVPLLAQQQTPTTKSRRSRGGGGSSKSGNSSDAPAMKELPCPKGFKPAIDSRPHLQLAEPASSTGGRRRTSTQTPTMKKTLARRCVPDKPPK